MYLEIMPNGSKYWRLKFRFAGKEKRLALGVYSKMTLVEARGEREKAKDLLKNDVDPFHQRKVEKITKVQFTRWVSH